MKPTSFFLGAFITALGSTSPSCSGGGSAMMDSSPLDFTGSWSGTWSTADASGPVELVFAQQPDFTVSGTIAFAGTNCLYDGDFQGIVQQGMCTGGTGPSMERLELAFDGSGMPADGCIQGTFRQEHGPCHGMEGTLAACRVTPHADDVPPTAIETGSLLWVETEDRSMLVRPVLVRYPEPDGRLRLEFLVTTWEARDRRR